MAILTEVMTQQQNYSGHDKVAEFLMSVILGRLGPFTHSVWGGQVSLFAGKRRKINCLEVRAFQYAV